MAQELFKLFNQLRKTLDFYENWKIWPLPFHPAPPPQDGPPSGNREQVPTAFAPVKAAHSLCHYLISNSLHQFMLSARPQQAFEFGILVLDTS